MLLYVHTLLRGAVILLLISGLYIRTIILVMSYQDIK